MNSIEELKSKVNKARSRVEIAILRLSFASMSSSKTDVCSSEYVADDEKKQTKDKLQLKVDNIHDIAGQEVSYDVNIKNNTAQSSGSGKICDIFRNVFLLEDEVDGVSDVECTRESSDLLDKNTIRDVNASIKSLQGIINN